MRKLFAALVLTAAVAFGMATGPAVATAAELPREQMDDSFCGDLGTTAAVMCDIATGGRADCGSFGATVSVLCVLIIGH